MISTIIMRHDLEAIETAENNAWQKLKSTLEWQLWNELNMKKRNLQDQIAAAELLNRKERVA